MDCNAFRFVDYAAEVACDLVGLLINPDAEPFHPRARALVVAALAALAAAGLAWVYSVDGVIAL